MGLVGVGGMLLGLDSSIDPLTGTRILLSLFAAAVLGGLGSVPGAVLGAFLIGMAEELSVLVVGSQYRAAVGFIAILVGADLRPRGLLGERAFDALAGPRASGCALFCIGDASERHGVARSAAMAELSPLHRHHRRHLRPAGPQPQPDLGRRRHGQSRPGRLLCLVGAYASALLTTVGHAPDRRGLADGAGGGRLRRPGRHAVDHAPARGLSRHRHLGFAEAVRLVASNEIWLTRGTDGISGIPGPWKRALGPDFNAVYFLIVVLALLVVFFLMRRIDRSPYGRALRAIREDAQVAQVAGKPVLRFKTEAFVLSAAIAGLAGALYGHFTSYIAPDMFLPLITVYIFLAVASGGTGRPAGALVGAYMVMTLLEILALLRRMDPGRHGRATRRAQGAADRRRAYRGAEAKTVGRPARARAARAATFIGVVG